MKQTIVIQTQLFHSPCGDLLLGAAGGKLCLCDWVNGSNHAAVLSRLCRLMPACFEACPTAVTQEAARQLEEYFRRERTVFQLPLLFVGTDFQLQVWNILREIPYGKTLSYGEQSRRLGCPKAVRAVANANGANAISIIVPCHRVIGSNGLLTGYGGGLEAKRFLLELEGAGFAKR